MCGRDCYKSWLDNDLCMNFHLIYLSNEHLVCCGGGGGLCVDA